MAVPQFDLSAIGNQLIRHPTRLGALASIRGTSPESLAREALAGIGDTQSPMDKHLDGQRLGRRRLELLKLFEGTLPGQHNQVAAKLRCESDTFRTGNRHLSR